VTGVAHWPAGSLRVPPYPVAVTAEPAGARWSSLRVVDVPPGGAHRFATGDEEVLVLPLAGAATVACDGVRLTLAGRDGVFDRVTDFAYLPPGATAEVASTGGGRFALPGARARRRFPVRYGPAGDVPVELRGAGAASRQVVNFCTPEAFACDRLIACEVFTPAGNWSSWPPHKHDEQTPTESALEETYYFEVAGGPGGPGMAYQRVYGSADRTADLLAEVRTGDVVFIPHGWHGPSMAAPGYDLYYLNVMAGPGPERAWRICDDPAHGWVRDGWADQPVDRRLPLVRAERRRPA
jgi:5-deoxy-glucuronate isomerase